MILEQHELNEIFRYDAETGKLFWRQRLSNRIQIGDEAGRVNKGYRRVRLFTVEYNVHLLIWIMHFGQPPEGVIIDHKDRNPLNNRIDNLRLATYQQNSFNVPSSAGATSKYKGVHWMKLQNKWAASIQFADKQYHIGTFDCEKEAAKAYQELAKELHGEFYVHIEID
jgi:hypothetical protein